MICPSYALERRLNEELSNKLAEELKLEGSMDEGMEIPASIQDYLEKGPFKVSTQRILLTFRSLIFLALMRLAGYPRVIVLRYSCNLHTAI